MKLILTSLLGISFLYSFEYGLKPTKISDKIYCYFGKPEEINRVNNGNMVNSCFINTGKSYIVIDSGSTYTYAHETTGKIRAIKNLPISNVIITHAHDDHWLGNSYYSEIGAKIIGSSVFDGMHKEVETRMKRNVSPVAYEKTVEIFPSVIIKDDVKMTIDNEITMFFHVIKGKAHSSSDMTVAIPSLGIIFAGDLVFNDRLLSLRDGDLHNWIKELEYIDAQKYRFVIGGHGDRYDTKSTVMTLNYLRDIRDFVKKSIDNGMDIQACIAKSNMPKYNKLKLYSELHKRNIETAYRMMEWENE